MSTTTKDENLLGADLAQNRCRASSMEPPDENVRKSI